MSSSSAPADGDTPPLADLVWLGIRPILKLVLMSGSGAILARRGIVRQADLLMISKVLYTVLYPCLLFSIATCIDPGNISALGIVVAVSAFFMLLGLGGGFAIRKAVGRLGAGFGGGILSACTFGNWGDFPLAVSASLTDRPPFKPGDSKTAAAYISFFILTWNIAFFPMGGSLLIASDYKHTKKGLPVDCVTAAEPQTTPPHSGGEAVIQEKSEGAAVAMCSAGVPQFADVENGVLSDSNRRRADEQRPSNTDAKIFPRLAALAKRGLLQTCTAANVGLVLGLAVGVTPPLRKIVVDDGSNSAPLAFLLEAAKFMGDGAVPLALISAGATLSKLNAGTSRPMIVALIAAFRLLVCPAIAIFGTVCLARAGLVDENDKVLLYVISFMGCTPSATSNLFITQLYNNGDAGTMAAVLLSQYTVGAVLLVASIIMIMKILF